MCCFAQPLLSQWSLRATRCRFRRLPGLKNWAWCHGRSAMKHCSQDVMDLNITLQKAAENEVPQIFPFWVLENAGELWDQLFWKGVPFIASCHHLSTKHNKAGEPNICFITLAMGVETRNTTKPPPKVITAALSLEKPILMGVHMKSRKKEWL